MTHSLFFFFQIVHILLFETNKKKHSAIKAASEGNLGCFLSTGQEIEESGKLDSWIGSLWMTGN